MDNSSINHDSAPCEDYNGQSKARVDAYNTLVAICDVLGFKNLLSDNKPTEIAVEMQQYLGRCIHKALYQDKETKPLADIRDFQMNPDVGVVLFSDTLLIYGRHGGYTAIDGVLKTVSWLLFQSLDHTRFRFRAGLSYGLLCADFKSSIFLGPAIVAACELEKNQEWMGAAADQKTSSYLSNELYKDGFTEPSLDPPLVRYQIPLKKGINQELLAVNWVYPTPPGFVIKPPSEEYLNRLSKDEREKLSLKYINTLGFFDEVSRQSRKH
jgi:hypothetical protein